MNKRIKGLAVLLFGVVLGITIVNYTPSVQALDPVISAVDLPHEDCLDFHILRHWNPGPTEPTNDAEKEAFRAELRSLLVLYVEADGCAMFEQMTVEIMAEHCPE